MLIYNGAIIAGGGTIVLPMTRAEYEANKAILDSADVWVDLTDEPDAVATADQVAYSVSNVQKGMGYIGSIATKAIAKVEPTDTALYLHEVGTYFINKDGDMCETDSQISIGGTIVLDANCHVLPDGISGNLSSLIVTDNVTYTATSIAGQAGVTISEDATKSGYTPIGIIDVKHAYNSDLLLAEMYIDSSTLKARYRNVGTGAITNVTFTFTVLYLKNM